MHILARDPSSSKDCLAKRLKPHDLCVETMGKHRAIVCFGDSLTFRYSPLFEVEYRKRFPDHVATILNAGIPGETSVDALRRLPVVLSLRPTDVVVCFGMNDWGKPECKVPLADFISNLHRIVDACETQGVRVLLITPNPVKGDALSEANRALGEYVKAIRTVAHETKVRLVDVHKAWLKKFNPIHRGLEDSLHTNMEGRALYAQKLAEVIERRSQIILWQYNGNPCQCNYRCPYCSYRDVQVGDHFKGTIDIWYKAFRDTFRNQHLQFYLAHGEPMLGKQFYDVVDMVGSEPNWEVRMTSNISQPLDRLVATVPAREGRLNINASFHPYMVSKERFLERALFLRDHGIIVPIVYVMYPPLLKRFEKDFEFFDNHNFLIHVRRFRGVYKEKLYPESYTDAECQYIARYCDDATIRYMLFNEPSAGKLSWTGVDFFIVDNVGNTGYCDDFRFDRYCLGNIIDGTFQPLSEAHPFPGRNVSDGTVDGVANFVELRYEQLSGKNVLDFSRQGGVYHTCNGVYYKNRYKDFADSRTRAKYHFPARNLRDAVSILLHGDEPLFRRMERVACSGFPSQFNYRNIPVLRAFVKS